MSDTTAQQDALAAIKQANEVVSALCNGKMGWRMSVPAEPDSDPDLVISRALHLAEERIRNLERRFDIAATDDRTCPCGAPLVRGGYTVKSHWIGAVCEDCEADMFRKHAGAK